MENLAPAVSVVIPVFNVTKYIGETLDSLRQQTFRNFETILVNDGCPDTENLERVLEPYRDEIVYIKSGKWASISSSRNTAIRASKGKYIALLDGDDAWDPEYLSTHVGMLEADPSIDLVYPNAVYTGETEFTGKFGMDYTVSNGDVTLEALIKRTCNVCISVTAKRESLERAGLFDPLVRGGEDWDLWMRLARVGGKIVYHRKPLLRYRIRKGSMSDDKLDLLNNGLTVYKKHLNLPGTTMQQKQWLEEAIQKQQATIDLVHGKLALYGKRRMEALELLERANRVLAERRIGMAILGLRLAPGLLYRYIHKRYPTEYAYLH